MSMEPNLRKLIEQDRIKLKEALERNWYKFAMSESVFDLRKKKK